MGREDQRQDLRHAGRVDVVEVVERVDSDLERRRAAGAQGHDPSERDHARHLGFDVIRERRACPVHLPLLEVELVALRIGM
eukprot:13143643-Heterocapsa_arctica.AAC.1